MDALVVPGLLVDGLRAADLDLAAVDLVLEPADQAAVLVLVASTERRGEREHGPAPVAVPEKVHRPAQRGAVPPMVFANHDRPPRAVRLAKPVAFRNITAPRAGNQTAATRNRGPRYVARRRSTPARAGRLGSFRGEVDRHPVRTGEVVPARAGAGNQPSRGWGGRRPSGSRRRPATG